MVEEDNDKADETMMMTMILTILKMMITMMLMTIIMMMMMHMAIKVYYKLIAKKIILNENESFVVRIPEMCEYSLLGCYQLNEMRFLSNRL